MEPESVDELSAPMALKELLDWIGADRTCAVACPDIIPLAGHGQLVQWLEGEPVPAQAELRIRTALKIIRILESVGGLYRALATLDEPTELAPDVTLLQILATAGPIQQIALVVPVRQWADGQR